MWFSKDEDVSSLLKVTLFSDSKRKSEVSLPKMFCKANTRNIRTATWSRTTPEMKASLSDLGVGKRNIVGVVRSKYWFTTIVARMPLIVPHATSSFRFPDRQ